MKNPEEARVIEVVRLPIGTFCIDANDIVGKQLKSAGSWEPWLSAFYNKVVQRDWVCIDAGANIGVHAMQLGTKCKKVYAFEPQKLIYNHLCANTLFNNLDFTIENIRKGLGDKKSTEQLWDYKHEIIPNMNGFVNWGGRGIENNEGNPYNYNPDEIREHDQIQVVTLDSYNFKRCDLIKIDVQGYEFKVFNGGVKLLKNQKPIILLENNNKVLGKELENNIKAKNYLYDLGYEIYRIILPHTFASSDDCICIHPDNPFYHYSKTAFSDVEDCFEGPNADKYPIKVVKEEK